MSSSLNGTGVTFSDASTQSVGTSGNFKFNSGYGSEAVAYGCRAWVNFNGTGTVAIRASGNVTSITDNGTGNYTVNFTTAMPDASYAVSGFANYSASSALASIVTYGSSYSPSVSAVQIGVGNSTTAAAIDVTYVNVTITR